MARDLLQEFECAAEYCDVVVVGNGPSALALSFMLAGNHPYYRPPLDSHVPSSVPPYLHYKLFESGQASLLDQNLDYLSEGIFGRSSNPVSNLFDTLNNPGADLGEHHQSLLDWKRYPGHRPVIDHVVLGRGQIGGLWQKMPSSMKTVSPAAWLQLPAAPFDLWLGDDSRPGRISADQVARYYTEYASHKNLLQFFRSGYRVESVRPFAPLSRSADSDQHLWLVEGTCLNSANTSSNSNSNCNSSGATQRFRFVSRVVVLACGGAELPVRLPCARDRHLATHSLSALYHLLGSGCLDNSSHFLHHYSSRSNCSDGAGSTISRLCSSLSSRRQSLSSSALLSRPAHATSPDDLPLLVVGAGLSAADAVLAALRRKIPVVHVFRRRALDRRINFASLPSGADFDEYHQLVAAMRDETSARQLWPHYRPLAETRLISVDSDSWVTLATRHVGQQRLRVRHVAVLIGSRPCLSFVHVEDPDQDTDPNDTARVGASTDSGEGGEHSLGVDSSRAVDCRANPINCDLISHQVAYRSGELVSGLFAVGPLVGDNLVRFLQGSAMAVAAGVRRVLLTPAADDSSGLTRPDADAVMTPEIDSGCCSEDGSVETLGDLFTPVCHAQDDRGS